MAIEQSECVHAHAMKVVLKNTNDNEQGEADVDELAVILCRRRRRTLKRRGFRKRQPLNYAAAALEASIGHVDSTNQQAFQQLVRRNPTSTE